MKDGNWTWEIFYYMVRSLPSLEDLIRASQGESVDEDSMQGKLQKTQQDIKLKENEKTTSQLADDLGVPYIKLFGFPISPEALGLIKEEEARELNAVCFFYDGQEIRIGTVDPNGEAIKGLLERLKEKYFASGKIYLISEYSLGYALNLYRMIPKLKKFSGDVQVTENDLSKFTEKFSSFRDLQNQLTDSQITDTVILIMAAA